METKTDIAKSFNNVLKLHNKEDIDKWLDNRIFGNNYKKKGKKDDHNWFKEIEKTTRDTEVC